MMSPPSTPRTAPNRAGIAGWVLFDWASQPVYTLVLTFLFAPYFASGFYADAVQGQAVWGYLIAISGFIVAFASPVVGAIADVTGRRKIWIFGLSVFMICGLCSLWLAAPGAQQWLIPVAVGLVVALVAAEIATVFTNAMMAELVSEDALGRLSGTGWAVGYLGGLASLVVAAGLLVADPATGKTMLGATPLLPLDGAAREGDRVIGPFSALWYLIFVIPLFLFTPDSKGSGASAGAAVRQGLGQLKQTFLHVRQYGGAVRFLVARMLYADGLGAIFAFGGVYGAAVFGWSTIDLGMFGILLTITGAAGAFVGGILDDRFGPKSVIIATLIGLMIGAVGIVSIDATHVLFVVEMSAKEAGSSAFTSGAEYVYLAFAVLLGLVAGPLQSASRSYFARIAPPDMRTEFFGLYAFSGKITAFAAPLLVGTVTAWSGSQRLGIATILLFLSAGLAIMMTVRRVKSDAS